MVNEILVNLQQEMFLLDNNLGTLLLAGGKAPSVALAEAVTSGYEVASTLDVPAGAVVDLAVVRVAASSPNRTPIGGVATIRAAAGDPEASSSTMIIDFGVMRNVSALEGPVSIKKIAPWLGTSFEDVDELETPATAVGVQELLTERLLVAFSQSVTAADVAIEHVTTSTVPADLELLVAGTRAWFHQGSVSAGFAQEVDITSQVQEAVAAGTSPVPVVLTSRVPGHLELSPVGEVQFLSTHVVQFGQGDTTSVDASAEGIVDVPLPLPPSGASWSIHRLVSTVIAEDRGPERVLPAVGPGTPDKVELTLDADRRLAVRIPTPMLAPFDSLSAVRILLTVGTAGIGVVGGLRGGDTTMPGDNLPGGAITEVTIPLSDAPTWVTLPFAKPIAVTTSQTLWLSLSATHGRAVLGLREVDPVIATGPDGSPLTDDERGIATIRRIAPNGVAKPMSSPVGLRTDALALRLVGEAPDGRPIDVVTVELAGLDTGAAAEEAGVETTDAIESVAETSDGPDRYVLSLPQPAPVPGLVLRSTVTAATRLTVGPVIIAYEEQGGIADA